MIDIPYKGKRFRWFSGDGRSKSRLDRFLVSNSVSERCGIFSELQKLLAIKSEPVLSLVSCNKKMSTIPPPDNLTDSSPLRRRSITFFLFKGLKFLLILMKDLYSS